MPTSDFHFAVLKEQKNKKELLESIYRLRYQVYVNEWGFEKPEDHPNFLEKDTYDQHSIHFFVSTLEQDNVIGTARIIMGSDLIFPIEQHFHIVDFPDNTPREKIGEISRLAISKEYRRRAIDRVIFSRDDSYLNELEQQNHKFKTPENERRKCEHELIRGIYLLIYRESKKLGLTHWYAVMARALHVILNRWGIPFVQIGPEKEYHGTRAPYALKISDLEKSLTKKNPELLSIAQQLV